MIRKLLLFLYLRISLSFLTGSPWIILLLLKGKKGQETGIWYWYRHVPPRCMPSLPYSDTLFFPTTSSTVNLQRVVPPLVHIATNIGAYSLVAQTITAAVLLLQQHFLWAECTFHQHICQIGLDPQEHNTEPAQYRQVINCSMDLQLDEFKFNTVDYLNCLLFKFNTIVLFFFIVIDK